MLNACKTHPQKCNNPNASYSYRRSQFPMIHFLFLISGFLHCALSPPLPLLPILLVLLRLIIRLLLLIFLLLLVHLPISAGLAFFC